MTQMTGIFLREYTKEITLDDFYDKIEGDKFTLSIVLKLALVLFVDGKDLWTPLRDLIRQDMGYVSQMCFTNESIWDKDIPMWKHLEHSCDTTGGSIMSYAIEPFWRVLRPQSYVHI